MADRRPGRRRSLSHVGGNVELASFGATEADARYLGHALEVSTEDESTRAHVHGFHSYPARLHPTTAHRLVAGLSIANDVVLDPFCGSGTVLVEARLLGRRARGSDVNPLAVELAFCKARGTSPTEREDLAGLARRVTEEAEARRARKAGATHRYGREDVALFDPHVLLELDGIAAAIATTPDGLPRRLLRLVLSSILVKVSRRPGDTATRNQPRRLSSGFTVRLFAAKARELIDRLEAYSRLLPAGSARATREERRDQLDVRQGDARKLPAIAKESVNLIVTSPPYPANYDYLAQHDVRLRWLGLSASTFEAAEIGARRHLEGLPSSQAIARWREELTATLAEMARVLAPSGKVVLVIADTVVRGRPLYADDVVRELAPTVGLALDAVASQKRPHFHAPSARAFAARPRREHAILLRRSRDDRSGRARPTQ